MSNETLAIEAFIEFCDTNMIAEESTKTMEKRFNELHQTLDELVEEFHKTDEISKKITMMKSIITITKQYDAEMQKDGISKSENVIQYIKIVVGSVVGILSCIGASQTSFRAMGGGISAVGLLELLGVSAGGYLTGKGAGSLMANKMDDKTYKSATSDLVKIYTQILNMLERFKSEKFTSYKEAEKVYKIKLKGTNLIIEKKK